MPTAWLVSATVPGAVPCHSHWKGSWLEFPPAPDRKTLVTPVGVPGSDVVAVICVSLLMTKDQPLGKFVQTTVVVLRWVPAMMTVCPPALVPWLGVRLVMAGGTGVALPDTPMVPAAVPLTTTTGLMATMIDRQAPLAPVQVSLRVTAAGVVCWT